MVILRHAKAVTIKEPKVILGLHITLFRQWYPFFCGRFKITRLCSPDTGIEILCRACCWYCYEDRSRDRAKDEYERYRTANENARKQGNASTPFSERDVEQRRLGFVASEASVSRTKASAEQARLAYTSEIDGVNTTVARLEAELRKSEFDLGDLQLQIL